MRDSNNDDMIADRDEVARSARRRSLGRGLLRWTARGLLSLVLLLVVALGALAALTRTESGAAWLTRFVPRVFNSLDLGLHMELDSLRGPLPERLRIRGLRLSDRRGLWLVVPSAGLDLRLDSLLSLSGGVWKPEVERLRLSGVRFFRLPDLPPSAPTPPSAPKPLSLLPSWLRLEVAAVRVHNFYAGPELLGTPGLGLTGDLTGKATVGDGTAAVHLEVAGLRPETTQASEPPLSAEAVKSALAPFLEQLTGAASAQSTQPSSKESGQQSPKSLPLPSSDVSKHGKEQGAARQQDNGSRHVGTKTLPNGGAAGESPGVDTRQTAKQIAQQSQEQSSERRASREGESGVPTPAKTAGPEAASGASSGTNKNAAALRAVVDVDLADDTLIVRLEAEDAGLLPYFVPALGGATLRTEIRAHAPLLPPAPEGPLEVRLRGAFAVRAAGQTAFGKMSALGLDLRWDGRRLTIPELAVSMPEEQPQLTLRGGGGLDPLLGPGAALTAGVRDLRTLSVLLGLSQQEPAGTATVRLELGHGRILRDWWRDSLWDSGADSSRTAASAARQDSRNAARVASYDGSHDNSSDGSADSTIDHRRDALRDGSRDDSRAIRADRKRDNIVHSFPDSVIRSSQSSSDDGLDDEAHDNRGNSGTHHKGRASHDSSSDVARYAAADGFPKASSKEARDGSAKSTPDSSADSASDSGRDVLRVDSGDGSRISAADGTRDSRAYSESDGAGGASRNTSDGDRDDAAREPLRLMLDVVGTGLRLPGGTVDDLRLRLEGFGTDGTTVIDGLPDAASGTLRLTARSLFGLGAAKAALDWDVAGLHGSAPQGSLRGVDVRIPGVHLSGEMRARLPETASVAEDVRDAASSVREPRNTSADSPAGRSDFAASPVSAGIATDAWPLLDGALHLRVTDWQALARLARTPLGGEAASLHLEARPQDARQRLELRWELRRFQAADAVDLVFCKGEVYSADMYGVIGGLSASPSRAARRNPPLSGGKENPAGAAPTLDGALELGAGSAGPVRWDSGKATVRVYGGEGVFDASLRGPVDAAVRGSYHFGDRLLRMNILEVGASQYGLGVRLERPAKIGFRQGLDIDDLELSLSPQGRVAVRARLHENNLRLSTSVDGLPLELAHTLAGVPLYGGTLSASVNLSGTRMAPGGQIGLTLADVPLSGVPGAPKAGLAVKGVLERAGRGGVHNLRLTADVTGIEGLGPAGGSEGLTATATLPLRFDPVPGLADNAPVTARVFWRGDVAPLWRLVPLPGRSLSGRGEVRAALNGTLKAPRLEAEAFLGGGRYVDRLEGVVLDSIALEARYATGGPSLLRLAAGDGRGGTLVVDGSLTDMATRPRVAARGLIRNLRPLHRDDLAVQLSGTLNVSGPLSGPLIKADIRMDQGAFQILNNFGGGVTTLDDVERGVGAQPCRENPFAREQLPLCGKLVSARAADGKGRDATVVGAVPADRTKNGRKGGRGRGKTPAPTRTAAVSAPDTAPADGGPRLDLKVTAPGKFFIRGKGLESEWRANLAVKGTVAHPQLVGSLAPVRGQFDLLGRTFTFEQGNITFDGGDPPNPLLNLTLKYQGQQIVALIMARGTARHPRLDLSSRPVLPKDEIMAQILFGKSMSNLSRFETIQAAAAAAQLISGGPSAFDVLSKTRDMLGLQVLRLGSSDDRNLQHTAPRDASQQGTVSDTAAQAPTLEAGKYVLDNVYVGVEQGAEPGAGTTVRVDIDLFPHVSVEGRTSNESSGVGINWKLDY